MLGRPMTYLTKQVGIPKYGCAGRPGDRNWPFVAALALQNLFVYWGHYFQGVGFPWDFSMSYYAMVGFWTAAVQQGVFPQWIPFQQMGYPLALQFQSGINYLPLWMFPALNLPYTLHAAIVVQCIHVFAGSLGMFVLVRHLEATRGTRSLRRSPFSSSAVSIQTPSTSTLFVPSPYAVAAYVFTLDAGWPRRCRAARSSSLRCCYCFSPARIQVTSFLAASWLRSSSALQFMGRSNGLTAVTARATLGRNNRVGLARVRNRRSFNWDRCGCFATISFEPKPLVGVPRETIWIEHLRGPFLVERDAARRDLDDIDLRVAAHHRARKFCYRGWIQTTVGVCDPRHRRPGDGRGRPIAVGAHVKNAIPVLGLSRFPSSDYRIFVAIALILLAIQGLRGIVEKRLSPRAILVRGVLCVCWLGWGLPQVHSWVSLDLSPQ